MKKPLQSGFTLVEVLVTVSITAVLLSTVYGIFTGVSNARKRVESEGRGYHLARVLSNRMAREIRSTYWQKDHEGTDFFGDSDNTGNSTLELSTTAASPLGRSAGGIARIRYSLEEDRREGERQWRLIRREAPLFDTEFDRREGQRLSDAVELFELRYYDGDRWVEQWDAALRGRLPQLVEIRMEIMAGDSRLPFVTVVDVPLAGAAP